MQLVIAHLLLCSNLVNSLNLNMTKVNIISRSLLSSDNSSILNETSERISNNNDQNLSNVFPNPTDITKQIQSTFQSFIETINRTISSSPIFSSLIGSLRNISSQSIGTVRLDEANLLVANVSELLRTSNNSSTRDTSNGGDSPMVDTIKKAYEDFQSAVLQFRSLIVQKRSDNDDFNNNRESLNSVVGHANNNTRKTNVHSLRRMWDQLSSFHAEVDSTIHKSISKTRENLENSLSVARQGSHIMRNQTVGLMNDIRRVFSTFTEPFKRFLEDMKNRLPTVVATA